MSVNAASSTYIFVNKTYSNGENGHPDHRGQVLTGRATYYLTDGMVYDDEEKSWMRCGAVPEFCLVMPSCTSITSVRARTLPPSSAVQNFKDV